MTAERWQRVKEVLQEAWEHEPAERHAFVDQACVQDLELRGQVQRLLASDENMGDFLLAPAIGLVSGNDGEEGGAVPDGRRIGSYRLLREIGHGGMGRVYLAERADGQYRKQVAIKLVSPDVFDREVLRRFRGERQVEAALDHPNIARLLDGGTTEDGLPYLVMEYVEGVRIDDWCDSHKFPVRDRLRLFQQVCSAVQYAHDKQVIHRDIKPGNILVTAEGMPKLLDFGIAKVLSPELSGDTLETTIGPGPMTPEFASPEQVRGERVSPASDIYALGVLLYHLLTGGFPYSLPAGDLRGIAQVICEREPVKPSSSVGESDIELFRQLAGDLDNIVLKALCKEPERRYSSAAEFSRDIDRFLTNLPVHARKATLPYRTRKFLKRKRALIAAVASSAVVVLAMMAGLSRVGRFSGGMDTVRSIAVLPLENLSGDREQEYFADGMTDALISDLARIRALHVISRTSAMSYKGVHRRLPEIAHSLGVATIAEGSVLRAGNRVRIAIRLVDAQQDRSIWSGSYEGELQNVLALQEQVAAAIAGEIDVTLASPKKGRISQARRVDLGAYDAYLKGRHQYLTEFSDESIQKALGWFRQALTLDPTYAPAYAGMADCYYMISNQYYAPAEVMPKAKWAAQKALDLDDTIAEAHATLALVKSLYEFDRSEAEKGFKRAIELKPSDAQIHLWYGLHLAGMGRFDEAVAEVERALKLDPISPAMNAYVGAPLYLAHRYDQSIQRMQPIAVMSPDTQLAHAFLALAYEQKGELVKAISEMERAYELEKEPQSLAQLGHMYAVSGRTAEARKALAGLKELSHHRYVAAYDIGVLHAGLGERDEAFRWLQKVEEDRSEWFAVINVDPRLDALHSDPRWAGILRSVGLSH